MRFQINAEEFEESEETKTGAMRYKVMERYREQTIWRMSMNRRQIVFGCGSGIWDGQSD